ncbi:LamG-like jellyroll fold domain-containing protein [Roseibacillus persicicus]|uniref:LamG-like jellyroll fold domain-containing protein n=1 Tax=Roseibacillus persicicus TaxID=454148 RepID=UPI00280E1471|nr:LamG-like jellyroll fold domain-containing protein [Roseibacillus persicicus]MDQ8188934.1 PQQ-dependent sugar dehydrogenase [Roseibacillus persicicus]
MKSANKVRDLLVLAVAAGSSLAHGDLVHRWTFDEPVGSAPSGTIVADLIAGAEAVVIGEWQAQATFTGEGIRLPGTSNGNHSLGFMSPYLDLPDGLISSKVNLTIEIWAAPHSVTNYDRLFDFGRSNLTHGPNAEPGEINDINGQGAIPGASNADDNLYYSFAVGDDSNVQRLDAVVNDERGNPAYHHDVARATSLGQTYHYVCTFEDGVGTYGQQGGRLAWFRDAELVYSADVDFRLNEMEDVNNWLGRSQYTNDWNADAEYVEVRIWDHALSSQEIADNFVNGPDFLQDSDSDDDGLLDVAFEDVYFGNHDGVATPAELALHDGNGDADGDGFSNLEEQMIGTDPTDPQSPPPLPNPDHLWTFTSQADSAVGSGLIFPDEAGGDRKVTLVGQGGALDGRQVILPGSTTGNQPLAGIAAYLNLDNGIVSASPSVTFEAWATPLSNKTWARLFDFGRTVETSGPGAEPGEVVDGVGNPGNYSAHDNLSLTFNVANDLNQQQLEGEIDDNGPVFTFSTAPTIPGTEYHYVFVVEDGVGEFGSAGIRVSWYRDGVLQNFDDFNFRLEDLEDVNNWIGRSMYGGDSNAHLALNELRIYRSALGEQQVQASAFLGPDPTSGPPEPPAPAVIPTLRWDFNVSAGNAEEGMTFLDASSREELVVKGNGALLNGSEIVLPGGTNGEESAAAISAYLELPNGLISSFREFTIEGWMTPLSSRFWQRIWDFGSCTETHGAGALPGEIVDDAEGPNFFQANDNLFLSWNMQGTLGAHRLGGKINAGGETQVDTDLSGTTSVGSEHHFVMTVEEGAGSAGAGGCRVRWYRDSVFSGSIDLPFRLQDMEDVNNWIGRSNWSPDENSHLSLNELRVYDFVLSAQEVKTSFEDGPNTVFAPPVAEDDAATLHEGQKVLLDVLRNDSGNPDPTTVVVISPPVRGSTEVQPDGKILYSHTQGSGAFDSFTYTVENFAGASVPASVELTVTPDLRITNEAWTMPEELPPPTWTLEDALPGLTFERPVCLTNVPGDINQIYVCEQEGVIKRVADVTAQAPVANNFLDLTALGTGFDEGPLLAGQPENGLLGLAFHPDYENNGFFFVAYTVNEGGDYFQRVSRFSRDASDSTVADPNSEVVLLHIDDFGLNHNGGDLHFSPLDGYLYYATGDGQNSSSGQARSQQIDDDFYSGVFRLDVDKRPGNLAPNAHPSIPTNGSGEAGFWVPVDNPFVHASLGGDWDGMFNGIDYSSSLGTIRTEFWATGIRHAWRMSFDVETGELWVGDVGQVLYEEINRIERGGNYGWAYREGAHDFNGALGDAPVGFSSIDPVYEYVHTAQPGDPNFKGNSVVGGSVYRGASYPSLVGNYVFCDSISGHVWKMDLESGAVERLTGLPGAYGVFSSMGTDPATQDILFCAYLEGKIMRLTLGSADSHDFPQTLSDTGLFADLVDLSPSPGLLPYQPNLRFWSDHATKNRWFGIPHSDKRMTWTREGAWTYPSGMVWVKHFELATERGNAATNKRLETRVLVKNEEGAYGVTYRWNEEQTEAYLVPSSGAQFELAIDEGGDESEPHIQTWELPSRSACMTCHQGDPLSFTTRQLNLSQEVNGFSGNLLTLLEAGGYLSNSPDPLETLPFHVRPDELQYSLEQRVRSYLSVNCAYCHQDGGSVGGLWDGREALMLEETGLINRAPIVDGGDARNKYVVPGEVAHSVLLHRIAATPPFTRMPPLSTSELDEEAIALVTEWIQSGLPQNRLYPDWAGPNGYQLTGTRTDDDDGDGRSNYDEFLFGSNPLTPDSEALLSLTGHGELTFRRQPFRRYTVETSSDLSGWESWNALPNTDSFFDASFLEVTPFDTSNEARRFWRLQVREP